MPAEHKKRRPGRRRRIGYVAKKRSKQRSAPHGELNLESSASNASPSLQEQSPELEFYESDNFFKTCLEDVDGEIITPSDDIEHYVILDRVYRHNSEDDLDKLRESRHLAIYGDLKQTWRKDLPEHAGFSCLQTSKFIRYIDVYDDDVSAGPVVKTCITVDHNFNVGVIVHGRSLPGDHSIYSQIPCTIYCINQMKNVLECVSEYKVCPGNNDVIYQNLLPVGAFLDVAQECSRAGYRENVNGSTIRSTKCCLLIKTSRCDCCTTYRRTLTKSYWRRKDRVPTPQKNWIKSTKGNSLLSNTEKLSKLKQMKSKVQSLETEVDKLRRKVKNSIKDNGVQLHDMDSEEMLKLMQETDSDVKKAYPVESSIQRLFWEQQRKYANLSNKKNMRWHPMIIKWAIFLKSKSSATYDALRRTGFIDLPSERTLYDYTNVVTRGTGFHDDVVEMLKEESDGFHERHQRIVGLLQDEVRIRSDLVYDKYSGELIGFVDLDSTGNDLLDMEQSLKKQKKTLARYVLVVMVRGLSTKLKFPLAHFATNGVLSDQLFSILWQAIEIVEIDVGLTVLFITSDGASPNRRFIHLHGHDGTLVYRAENVFALERRFVYFISDPPHLLKTARNNFSNSYSHKNTKKLWNNGKDISWLHIVDLYKDKCNTPNSCYRLVPLTKKHVDLVSFSYMKVNLAAQVMSARVANALEMTRPEETVETVKFIRHMNKFFDIMNTRNIYESVKKRNENVEPFSSADDPRLNYLTGEFLNYFDEWERRVMERRGNFTKTQRNTMLLSYQTIEGLKITVKSVVACVKFCLNSGMPFVLTERFNQDVIEQHFGVHRQSCGSNDNPSLHQLNSTMQKLRVVGGQALAPMRGNTKAKRKLKLQVDNTPLPKRPRV